MKKFLFIATLLAIAVFASAYTARNFYIELQLDQLDIMNYVDTDFPGHDAAWPFWTRGLGFLRSIAIYHSWILL